MDDGGQSTFEVACPSCQAKLTIDPALRVILHHEPAPKTGPVADLAEAVKALKGEATKREAKFQQSMEAEKTKGKVLEKKFQELLKKTKDEPVKRPLRDIDLD